MIDDKELDKLLRENFEREAICRQVSRSVMREISHRSRRAALRRVARMAAVAFGVPFALLIYAWAAYSHVFLPTRSPLAAAVCAVSGAAVIAAAELAVAKFMQRRV